MAIRSQGWDAILNYMKTACMYVPQISIVSEVYPRIN